MLTPCKPCMCTGAPCEQCMFGYRSAEDNHNAMKNLIESTLRGEKPLGYGVAEKYMAVHKNWREQIQEMEPKSETVVEERHDMKIVQIDKSEVIQNICNDVEVFRLKLDDLSIANLQDKSIKVIKRDMQKEDVTYLYFVLKEETNE